MTAFQPPVLLAVPPYAHQQRYGLFTVASPIDLPPHAGTGGVEYLTPFCTLPNGYVINCSPGAVTLGGTTNLIIGTPFVVSASLSCGTLGRTEDEFIRMTTDRLKAGEQAIVEKAFADGLYGSSPSLANNTGSAGTLPMLTPATSIDMAIGELESALYANYGPRGIIHIPISAANYVFSNLHVEKVGGIWQTQSGTQVVFGNYSGDAASGTTPATGHTTFYVTGQMAVFRAADADIFVSPYDASIDKVANQVNMFAEREYVIVYECYAAGVDVTLVAPS